jgi:hypothetical protein
MTTILDEGSRHPSPPPPIKLGEAGALEGVGPETHVHKIIYVPVVYMELGLNDFDAGTIHYVCHWKGWALKSRLFWALKWQRAKRVPFGPK